jgi:hypothetical protein
MDPSAVGPDTNFFGLGGDSFRAGRVVALLRLHYKLPLQVAMLYQHKTPAAIGAALCKEHAAAQSKLHESSRDAPLLEPLVQPCSPTNPVTLFIQALPGFVLAPCLRVCSFVLFVYALVNLRIWLYDGENFFMGVVVMTLAVVLTGYS